MTSAQAREKDWLIEQLQARCVTLGEAVDRLSQENADMQTALTQMAEQMPTTESAEYVVHPT